MKIRNGFVSNSSSSSFIVIGRKIYNHDVKKEVQKGKDIYCIGDCFGDGEDFFQITDEMARILPDFYYKDIEFVEVFATNSYELKYKDFKDVEFTEDTTIFSIEGDYHYTQTAQDFKERYIDEI